MQALIPVFAILGVAAGARLTLLPYAYLADPLPVYQQSQDTRTGVHAYSYAGGPSAKEEVRGLDGVTRGSYSYIDAHGILQSVFYVADEDGFRVAATNLPTDGDLPLESGEVLLATHLEKSAKVAQEEKKEERGTSRRKRSPGAAADQDHPQPESQSSEKDQADRESAKTSPKSSHELPAVEKKADEDHTDRKTAQSVPAYRLVDSVLISRLAGAATSHQSRVDIHNKVRLRAVQPIEAIGVSSEPVYEAVILPGRIPLATSHQSRVQVHNNLRLETPEKLAEEPKTLGIDVRPIQTPAVAVVEHELKALPLFPAVPDYNENRIELHKSLGLEGPNRKDTVKIDAAQLAIVEAPIPAAVPALPLVAVKEAIPLVTATSSQSKTQIHRDANLDVALPIVNEPTVYVATPFVQPTIAKWPILTPVAASSQYRSQIHSNQKIELTK